MKDQTQQDEAFQGEVQSQSSKKKHLGKDSIEDPADLNRQLKKRITPCPGVLLHGRGWRYRGLNPHEACGPEGETDV